MHLEQTRHIKNTVQTHMMLAFDLLPIVLNGKVERKAGNALGLGAGNNLEGLDNTRVGLQIKIQKRRD
ncbi:hypothetical protein BC936DRAFT_143260 [Jimgerdemannia flammicorona]|uniref:Uncharacterized protein n=2 Tax=Jimgerdemannia flammicorona TaxID=994334 RepID=A0A433QFR9_9FUNG|nr:hypothetical protein BC936DRAFT_143260 [Jimgerdemannia flammicorona]RUS28647.1 hypothetical protein BC938DRAFT_481635 [Jimgerdemannia flammicorona]